MQTATRHGRGRSLLAIGCVIAALLAGCQGNQPGPSTGPSTSAAAGAESAVPAPPAPTARTSSPATPKRVSVRETAAVAKGVRLRVLDVGAVDVRARTPGEISGPGIAITVEIRNSTRRSINVSTIQVNCLDANGVACIPSRAEPARAPRAIVKAGSRATGIFVFTVARSDRNPVRVTVDLGPGYRGIEFVGRIG